MLKWSLRILGLLLLVIGLMYWFRFRVGDGQMVVEPRPGAERQGIRTRIEEAVPGLQKQPPANREPEEELTEKDRQQLESILEEEL